MSAQYQLYNILSSEEDTVIYDPLSLDWNKYEWPSGYYPHKVSAIEKLKPYLISYAYYETVEYEDIILILNKLDELDNVPVGTELKIPKLEDLEDFILEYRK